jgi:hypothetical protein
VRPDPAAWTFTRSFERAEVKVDLKKKKATIDWR